MGFGAYGKIPALGDFFRTTPPPGFVEAWDPWVQARLLDVQHELGAPWREAYLGAPIWRFTLSAGLAGPSPILGVFMPSVDRVGRDFPLTLMAPAKGGAFGLHAAAEAAFAALEECALAMLGDESVDGLTARLAGIGVPALSSHVHARSPGHLVATGASAAPTLLEALSGAWSAPTIWSAALETGTRVFVAEGLPGPSYARALFDLNAPLWQSSPDEVPA